MYHHRKKSVVFGIRITIHIFETFVLKGELSILAKFDLFKHEQNRGTQEAIANYKEKCCSFHVTLSFCVVL